MVHHPIETNFYNKNVSSRFFQRDIEYIYTEQICKSILEKILYIENCTINCSQGGRDLTIRDWKFK